MKYVIIGGSAAGISGAEAIRSIDNKGEITVISDENFPLYSRCLITYYLAQTINEKEIKFKPDDFFKRNNIKSLLGVKAEKIMHNEKKIALNNGSFLTYDKLLIATGGSPKKLGIKGEDKNGVFGIRTIDDIKSMDNFLNKVNTAVVLGGGLIGMRTAYALRARGKKVIVIVKSNMILSQMLDDRAADIFKNVFEKNGTEIMFGLAANEVLGDKNVKGLKLDNGREIDCELVIIGKGVNSNIDITKGTDIKTEWGIVVDDYMQTTITDIYAAGDVVQTKDITTEEDTINALWPCAVEQGRIAGLNMAGERESYDGSLSMNSLVFYDIQVISFGIIKPKKEGYEQIVKENKVRNVYKEMVIKDNRLVGAVLVNDVNQSGVYNVLIRRKIDVSSIKEVLLDDNFNFAKILHLIKSNEDKFKEKEYKEKILTYSYEQDL
jgi:NAD(P)H-nitrite reductase large subunit